MGRLIIEMLGQDRIKILSMREEYPNSLNIRIEGTGPKDCAEINVDFKELIRLLNTLIANRKTG